MKENSKWTEIKEDISKNIDLILEKLDTSNLSNDIKETLSETIYQTSNLIKQLVKNTEKTVKDEEIKFETKKIINDIFKEFEYTINEIKNKVTKSHEDITTEEE